MLNALLVFLGCGLGGLLRYAAMGLSTLLFAARFPYGILIVNVSGSFLMGLLAVYCVSRAQLSDAYRSFLLIGLLGGYTTFSSFSLDTLKLLESAQYLSALCNVLLNVLLCVAAAWLGAMLASRNFIN